MRILFPILLLASAALVPAQTPAPAPQRQFLLRSEPVRKDLSLMNLSPEEQKLAMEHFGYLRSLYAEGKLTFAGQVWDPKGLWGVIVVSVPDAAAAQAILDGDPMVKGKMFRGEVIPFRTMIDRNGVNPSPVPKP